MPDSMMDCPPAQNRVARFFDRIGEIQSIAHTYSDSPTIVEEGCAVEPFSTWGASTTECLKGITSFVTRWFSSHRFAPQATHCTLYDMHDHMIVHQDLTWGEAEVLHWTSDDSAWASCLQGMARALSAGEGGEGIVTPEGKASQDYPVATYIKPTEYTWDAAFHKAEKAVTEYLGETHADHTAE